MDARSARNSIKGAMENGVDKKKAALEVSNLLDKFANYGFNKSHAAAYAVVSYQTAWLKTNHPVEFMAGVMNCDIHLTDKLAVYFEEVKKGLDLPWVPPCVNRSEATFRVVKRGAWSLCAGRVEERRGRGHAAGHRGASCRSARWRGH